jgi:hypothetical protein
VSENAASGEERVDPELSGAWKKIQTAIWLIGLAILAWQGWWWPGILVLVAISGLTEAALHWYAGKQQSEAAAMAQQQEAIRQRAAKLPDACPNCGSPISEGSVVWKGASTGTCPYCGSSVTGGKASAESLSGNGETATS